LDLAIVSLPVTDPMIKSETLWNESLLLAVARDHPLASKPRVTGADLAAETFILLGSSSSLADQVKRFCGENHFEPRIGSRCAQVATVKALVGIGAGISILPRGVKSTEDRDSLTFISLADSEPTRVIAVLRHMQRYQSRGAEQFLSLLRDESATHANTTP
jgi:LysR family hydrogen peroxide-inducible transcriptional activator